MGKLLPVGANKPDRTSLINKSVGVCGESTILPTPLSKLNTCVEQINPVVQVIFVILRLP